MTSHVLLLDQSVLCDSTLRPPGRSAVAVPRRARCPACIKLLRTPPVVLTPQERRVARALVEVMSTHLARAPVLGDSVRASVTLIASSAGYEDGTTRDHLVRLDTKGWIRRERPDRAASCVYTWLVNPALVDDDRRVLANRGSLERLRQDGQSLVITHVIVSDQTPLCGADDPTPLGAPPRRASCEACRSQLGLGMQPLNPFERLIAGLLLRGARQGRCACDRHRLAREAHLSPQTTGKTLRTLAVKRWFTPETTVKDRTVDGTLHFGAPDLENPRLFLAPVSCPESSHAWALRADAE